MTKLADIATTSVSRIDKRHVIKVVEDSTLIEIVGLLREHRRGAVLVVDADGQLSGIFTEHDLISKIDHSNHDWHGTRVSSFMTREVKSVKSSSSIAEAIGLMSAGGFRHLPVVDDAHRPTNLLSIRDIIVHIAQHYPQVFVNLPPNPRPDGSPPWGG
jgi:CBS domain-containing protein